MQDLVEVIRQAANSFQYYEIKEGGLLYGNSRYGNWRL